MPDPNSMSNSLQIPEVGQLVSVRSRHFVVLEVATSELPEAGAGNGFNGAEHAITLSSVEDDGLGEELKVRCT